MRINVRIHTVDFLKLTVLSAVNSRKKAREGKYLFSPPSVVPSVQQRWCEDGSRSFCSLGTATFRREISSFARRTQ